ncbi:DUF3352 domain-containing protein [bacterium]|nr:DUF3352 domain-containing protein [bacterium]
MTKKNTGIFTRKAIGLIIGLIGVFLLVFIVFYIISRVFRPQDLATMLPKDNVVALMQVSTNSNHEQVQKFYERLNNYDLYHPESLKLLINETFETNFDKDISPWLGRQVGVALLEKSKGKGQTDILLFAEVKDKAKTLDFLKSRGLQSKEDYLLSDDYKGVKIYRYSLSQTYNFMFINSYLVVSDNENALQVVVDACKKHNNQLISNDLYKKISQNLPINTLMFGYVDVEKLINVLKNNETFMSEKGRELLAFEPFLKLYKAFGITGLMENGNIAVQTFMSLDENYVSGKNFINFDTKFRAKLLNYISKDLVFYSGGLDLQKQIHRYEDIMSAGGEVSYLIFEGMLEAQKNKYLGPEIDLTEDVYPLLQGEYAFAINKNDKGEAFSVILKLSDSLRDRDKFESIVDSFIRKGAILAPKVVNVELEDGTTMQEIQTVPEEIIRSTEDYHGYEINVLTVGTQPWGIYYVFLDNVLVITTQQNQIHLAIDLFSDSGNSIKNSSIFRESISPIIRTTDEVIYFNINYLLDKTNWLPESFSKFIEPFKAVSMGTNYFRDGISSMYYIKID